MNQQNDNFSNENLIFETIASITCAIIIVSVIIVTFYFFKNGTFKNQVNYEKVSTTLEDYFSPVSKKSQHQNKVLKLINRKCQCDVTNVQNQLDDGKGVNSLEANHNSNYSNFNKLSTQPISCSSLLQPWTSINNWKSNFDSLGGEPTLLPQSIFYSCSPGMIPFQPYSFLFYPPISWNFVNHPLSNQTHVKSFNSTSSPPSNDGKVKAFQDKSAQFSSISCNHDNSDFSDLGNKHETRHGAKLNVTYQEHQRMMHEVYLKALERIQRLDKENQKHYQLDL